jgi:hypothetical protein
MRTKATLFLLVLVAGLGAYVYFFPPWPTQADPNRGETSSILPEAAGVDYLSIAFTDRPGALVLEKTGGAWRLSEPVKWPANVFAVERLIKQLQLLRKESSFPVPKSEPGAQPLSDYGLAPPEGVLVWGRRGERGSLLVGKRTEFGNRLYLRRKDGDWIHVVSDSLLAALRMDLADFRSDDVFTLQPFEVRSWNVQITEAGNLRVWLTRQGEKWRFDRPVGARADRAAVETLLGRILRGVKVVSFVQGASDPTLLGLANPAFRITVEGPGQRESLLIGNRAPESAGENAYYAQREETTGGGAPTVFVVHADFLDELRNIQLGLRDRRVIEFDPQRVLSLAITPAGRPPITLQKLEDGRWQVVSREGEHGLATLPGDGEVVQGLLRELAELRTVETGGFVSDAPMPVALEEYGLTLPAWRIVLTESVGGGSSEVRVRALALGAASAASAGREVYARVEDEGFVYLVDRALADDCSAEPHHYRDRRILRIPDDARLASLALDDLGTGETVLAVALASPDQTWEQALAGLPEARRAAVAELIARLGGLRARAFLAPAFDSAGPGGEDKRAWAWLLQGTIAPAPGTNAQYPPFKLHLGAFTAGTEWAAGSVDLDLVFSLDQALIDALAPLLVQRADPGPPPPGAGKPPGAEPDAPPPSAPSPSGGPAAPNP